MESRGEPRARSKARLALTLAGAAMTLLAACHNNANTATPGAPPLVTRAFGDTATFGVQVVALDREREVAKVALRVPADLIVLAVIPGREIELIVPSDVLMSTSRTFSKGTSSIDMRRWDDSPRPVDANKEAQAVLAYNRCMTQVRAAERRMAQSRVKRDSTGKVIDDGGSSSSNREQLSTMERNCDRLDASSNRPAPPIRMPPRAPADRYLVVIASSIHLTADQLNERLTTLTAVGSDVATTIEAIAAGLYAGLPGTWSGGYVSW